MAFVKSIPSAGESVGTVLQRYPDQGIPLTQLTEIVMRGGECGFSLAERELIAAFASGTNACTFCYNTHRATAEAFGVDEGLLEALLTDLEGAPVAEKLKPVLRYVRKLTQTPSRMTQSDADAIFGAGWSENDFHYAVMICALFNLYNRLMDGYGVRNTAAFREERGQMLADAGYAWVIDIFRRQ